MTVTVSQKQLPLSSLCPISTFAQLQVDERLRVLYEGFSAPSPIQQYAWPALFSKNDVVGISETGSGKTLAFSLPILQRIMKKKYDGAGGGSRKRRIRWVTIAPTRELALQTFHLISAVVPSVCVYGGVSRAEQVKELQRKSPVAVVATPGRLQDLLDAGDVDLGRVRFLVLDEADRMLDAGFEPAVSAIVARMPAKRQTVMFSATWPASVQKMAAKYTVDPVKITACNNGGSIGSSNSSDNSNNNPADDPARSSGNNDLQANANISQTVHVVEPHEKDARLLDELSHCGPDDKVIVFVLYKKEAPRVEALLVRNRYRVRGLHGDMAQNDRTAALTAFRSGTASVLIATDVAARGLDIPSVSLVFNYTFPLTAEDYVHRIGRTGRGGATGRAVTLFTAAERALAGVLQNVLRRAGQVVPPALAAFGSTTKRKLHKEYGVFYRNCEGEALPAATKIKFASDSE